MAAVLASAAATYTFEVDENLAKISSTRSVLGDVRHAVGVDSQRQCLRLQPRRAPGRGVLDKDGTLLRTWGEGLFPAASPGVHVAPDSDTIWLTDDAEPHRAALHARRQGAADPRRPRQAVALAGERRAFPPLHPHLRSRRKATISTSPTATAIPASTNMRLAASCSRSSWGEPGTDPGQFNIPHNICCDPDGWLPASPTARTTASRSSTATASGRTRSGNYLHRPNGMCLARDTARSADIGEGGPAGRDQPPVARYRAARQHPHDQEPRGHGAVQRQDLRAACSPAASPSPHGIAVDSSGQHLCRRAPGRSWERFATGAAPARRR